MEPKQFKILLKYSFFVVLFFGVFAIFKVSNALVIDPSTFFIADPDASGLINTQNNTQTIQQSTSILMHQTPTNPTPGESVTVEIRSYAENLDTSNIDWFADNKLIKSGIGIKSIVVTAPAAGSAIVVTAQITTSSRNKSQASTTIRPAEMDMLWESTDSYVPPFYKGKAMPTSDTLIKVVAMPEIRIGNGAINPKNLTYSWQQDFTNSANGSGFAKNSFLYRNDYLDRNNNIGVTAASTDGKYSAQSRITITPGTASLVFYKEDPLLGVNWDKAIQSPHRIVGDETIVAAPYYIAPGDIRRPDLTFEWYINNVPLNVGYTTLKNKLPLKVEEGQSGESEIKLQIDNKYKFFQTTSGVLRLQF